MEKEDNESKNKRNRNKKKGKNEDEAKKCMDLYETTDWTKCDSFESLPLSSLTRNGLSINGFLTPTEIQKQSIGFALRGFDVLGAAKTGSGKTLAFIVPILECLFREKWTDLDGVGALIITPTRELAYQIFEVLRRVGAYHDFSAGLIIGGKDLKFERRRMNKCNIMICTPGRLLQHMDENPLFNCDNMKILVLDEADRILDLGFAKTMNAIIENLPQERQTLLFSATQTKSVKDLARLSLKDPVYVSADEKAKFATPEGLTQSYIVCQLDQKINMLWSFIRTHLKQKTLVFMSTCKQVKFMYDLFCRMRPGISLMALYGTLHQLRRMAVYDDFCRKQNAVLFATDIASRGLDFPSVNWVLQMDCPEDVNTYIHRAGRTARYKKGGESLLVLLPNEEESMIKQLTDKKIPINKIEVNPSKMHSVQRKAEALCARDVNLKETAQRAFKSYVKNVFLMKDKTIFDVKQLDNESFARSLGLAVTPRVRFIEKCLKIKEANKKKVNNNKESAPQTKQEIRMNPIEENKEFESLNSDSDKEEDILSVKKVWRFDLDDEQQGVDQTVSKKSNKILTKAAVAKRILKKNFTPNIKITFDEEGNEANGEFPTRQISERVKKLDQQNTSGLDINLAKEIMQEEDKIDKKLYRELIQAKHKERRIKLKEEKRREKESRKMAAVLDKEADDEEDNVTSKYIDELPDPDMYYDENDGDDNVGQDSHDDDDDDDDQDSDNVDEEQTDESNDESSETAEEQKRTRSKKRKYESEESDYETMDTGLNLADDETLALHLLSNT